MSLQELQCLQTNGLDGAPRLPRTPLSRALQHSMPMLRLNSRQRVALGETSREFANLAAGALVLGQFLGSQRFSWWQMLAGFGLWLGMTGFGLLLLREEE